jgi:ABC-type multidrug transport system permease subunit
MLAAAFAGAGVVACIWGADVIHDRSHPAFWLWMVLMAPGMLIAAAGALAAIVLPVYIMFQIPMRRKGQPSGWLGAYIKAVERVLQDEW